MISNPVGILRYKILSERGRAVAAVWYIPCGTVAAHEPPNAPQTQSQVLSYLLTFCPKSPAGISFYFPHVLFTHLQVFSPTCSILSFKQIDFQDTKFWPFISSKTSRAPILADRRNVETVKVGCFQPVTKCPFQAPRPLGSLVKSVDEDVVGDLLNRTKPWI